MHIANKVPKSVEFNGEEVSTGKRPGRGGGSMLTRAAMRRLLGAADIDLDDGCARLVTTILAYAVRDLLSVEPVTKSRAEYYFENAELRGNWVMDVMGLDPEWVAWTLRNMDLLPARSGLYAL